MQHFTARLTQDAEVSTLEDGRKVVNFNVAKNDYYRTKAGEEKKITEYFQCAYWIRTGIADYLKKGTLVELFGRVSARAYTNKDGEVKAVLQMHTSAIDILHRSKTTGQGSAETMQAPAPTTGNEADDLPF